MSAAWSWKRAAATVVASLALLLLAEPPVGVALLAPLCLAPSFGLLSALANAPGAPRYEARLGALFGAVVLAGSVWWLPVAMWRYDHPWGLLFLPVVAIGAAYGALMFTVIGWLRRRTGLPFPLIVALVWTSVEWLVARQGELRFPWFSLGLALAGAPRAAQVADLIGARGLGFLLAATNAALAEAWLARADRRRTLAIVGAVAFGALCLLAYGSWRIATLATRDVGRIAIVQPDAGAREKWEPSKQDAYVARLIALTGDAARAKPDLLVWPETALPGLLQEHPRWDASAAALARTAKIPLLAGAMDVAGMTTVGRSANAAFLYETDGRRDRQPAYHKRALVLLVERFNGLEPGSAAPLYAIPRGRFGVLICYESVFEDLAREYRTRGADFLVNMTNDAWFGPTGAGWQSAAHLGLRAIENRMGIVRVANGGVSGFVDPFGRMHRVTRPGVPVVVAGALLTSDVVPFYARMGDWVGSLAVAGTAALILSALLLGASALAAEPGPARVPQPVAG